MNTTLACPHFPGCPGCSSIGMPYENQLDDKLAAVEATLEQFAPDLIEPEVFFTISASPKRSAYRNRVKLVPTAIFNQTDKIGFGLYRTGSHEVIDIPDCPVQMDGLNRIVARLRQLIFELDVSIYDESNHTGDLRFITLRQSEATNEALLTFVTRDDVFPSGGELARQIMADCESVVGVLQNVNDRVGNAIFGERTMLIAGNEWIEEEVCDARIRLGATSFFQINTQVAELAYQSIHTALEPTHEDALIDLYCGVGTIGLTLANYVRKVTGIESAAEAITLGNESARTNSLENVRLIDGAVEERLQELIDELTHSNVKGNHLLAAVNPPRKGLTPKIITQLTDAGPRRIAYLSCWPFSLTRDLVRFDKAGYRVIDLQCFDMFPQTPQVETLAVLER